MTDDRRPIVLTARFNEQEKKALSERAAKAGMTRSAYLRFAALDTPPPRGRRIFAANEETLARILAQLGKIGSNVNQLTHYAHLDRYQPASIDLALRDLHELRHAIMRALDLERPLPPQDQTGEDSEDEAA